ncbi:MAG: hypothetical protein LBK00_09815, partial [Treponema sp.]|nr:hypothetical protein [Treponema sp.]
GAGALGRWGAGALGRWGAGALGRWGAGALGRWGEVCVLVGNRLSLIAVYLYHKAKEHARVKTPRYQRL